MLTTILVAVLAIGIGANTALITLIEAMISRPLPGVSDADAIAYVQLERSGANGEQWRNWRVSYPEFLRFREQRETFGMLATTTDDGVAVRDDFGTEPRRATYVSTEFFSVVRPQMMMGTGFAAGDDYRPDALAHVVVSHGFWKQRLGARPDVLGSTIDINGQRLTVAGVMGSQFRNHDGEEDAVDVWLPIGMRQLLTPADTLPFDRPDNLNFDMVARLAPGVTMERARSVAALVAARLQTEHQPTRRADYLRMRAQVLPFRIVSDATDMDFIVFSGGGGLVSMLLLLIACANASGLLLARAVARRLEVGVKLALGASRARIARELLVESVLIALLAGVFGVLLVIWLTGVVSAVLPFPLDLTPRLRTYLLTGGVAIATGILFGMAPALHATRTSVFETLKTGGGALDPRRSRLLRAFVVAQLALGLPLLTAAGLFAVSMRHLLHSDKGFDMANHTLAATLDFSLPAYAPEQSAALMNQAHERISALPGVRSVAFTSFAPFFFQLSSHFVRLPGDQQSAAGTRPRPTFGVLIDPEYFATLGIPLLRGRGIEASDVVGAPIVAVVPEDVAARLWPGANPIGSTLVTGKDTMVTVVGVAGAVQYDGDDDGLPAVVYLARRQLPTPRYGMTLVVSTQGDARTFVPIIRSELQKLDPRLPLLSVRTFEQELRHHFIEGVRVVTASTAIGLLVLLLGCLGVYALIAFSVAQRSREIAIRMALGARGSRITLDFLRQASGLAILGLIFGAPMAVAMRFLLGSTTDMGIGITFTALVAVAAILLCTALAASVLPARRAAAVEPFTLLRTD